MSSERPDPQKRALLLQPQLSLPGHPSRWHNSHTTGIKRFKAYGKRKESKWHNSEKQNQILDDYSSKPDWTHQHDLSESSPHQWHSAI